MTTDRSEKFNNLVKELEANIETAQKLKEAKEWVKENEKEIIENSTINDFIIADISSSKRSS